MKKVLLFTVVLLVFIIGCKNDDNSSYKNSLENIKPTLSITIQKGNHLRETNPEIYQKLHSFSFGNNKSSHTENETTTLDFTLNLDKIQIIEKSEYTQYTTVVNHSLSDAYLINYLLLNFDDGTQYQYLITYPYTETDIGKIIVYTEATMEPLGGAIVLQAESGIGGQRPCLEGVPELVDSYQVYSCEYTVCSESGHVWGQECQCGETVQCVRATETCGWNTVNVWSCSGGGAQGPSSSGATGGGSSSNNNDDDPIETFPLEDEETALDRIIECINGTNTLGGNNVTIPNTLMDSLNLGLGNRDCFPNLDGFLQVEGCSNENQLFAIAAARTCLNKGEVAYEERILIDSTLVQKPCHAKVIKATFSGSSDLVQSVKDFFNDDTKYTYLLTTEVFTAPNDNQNAATDAFAICVQGNCSVETEFNTTYLNTATDLAIAKTALHESVHAILTYLFETGSLAADSANPDYKDLLIAYTNLKASLDPNNDGTQATLNSLQHEFMTNLVDFMADALRDYGQSRGYTLSLDYYKKLAWSSNSMMNTPNYTTEFSIFERKKVEAIGLAESTNTDQTYLVNQYDEEIIQPTGIQPNNTEPCNL